MKKKVCKNCAYFSRLTAMRSVLEEKPYGICRLSNEIVMASKSACKRVYVLGKKGAPTVDDLRQAEEDIKYIMKAYQKRPAE